MSAMQIRVLPAGSHFISDRLSRGLALFLLVATALFVLFCGSFPFDFSIPHEGMLRAIQQQFNTVWLEYDPGNVDRTENIFFFMPFGFALAANVRFRKNRALWQVAIALPASAVLSSFVELSQVFISYRDPSLQDVWCNTVGGVVGAVVFVFTGPRLLKLATAGLLKLRPLARPELLGTCLGLYAVLQLSAPLLIRHPGDLSVWDPSLPLSLGNETSQLRAWEGSVSDIALADRAASAEEAYQLAHAADPNVIFAKSLLGYYRPRGKGPDYPDLTGQLKPLRWMENQPDESATKDSPRPSTSTAGSAPPMP